MKKALFGMLLAAVQLSAVEYAANPGIDQTVQNVQSTIRSGQESVNDVVQSGQDAIQSGQDAVNDVVQSGQDAIQSGQDAVNDVVQSGQDAANDAIKDTIGDEVPKALNDYAEQAGDIADDVKQYTDVESMKDEVKKELLKEVDQKVFEETGYHMTQEELDKYLDGSLQDAVDIANDYGIDVAAIQEVLADPKSTEEKLKDALTDYVAEQAISGSGCVCGTIIRNNIQKLVDTLRGEKLKPTAKIDKSISETMETVDQRYATLFSAIGEGEKPEAVQRAVAELFKAEGYVAPGESISMDVGVLQLAHTIERGTDVSRGELERLREMEDAFRRRASAVMVRIGAKQKELDNLMKEEGK